MIRKGTKVRWKWGNGYAEGKIKELRKAEVEKKIKGTTVKRNGTQSDPAVLIEQEDGTQVLKLKSEVERAE
ncbi:hypervirulence associated TUDOR domain-containing protein [Telluribacter humicola]|uniref:DUF2945 domain-containing protein n=1 Tax=Telluribacter humicola TaxID=1720261 RepID=UPI001A96D780|nr:DUF2945 domain-containing protein [Telluribacter humicola]